LLQFEDSLGSIVIPQIVGAGGDPFHLQYPKEGVDLTDLSAVIESMEAAYEKAHVPFPILFGLDPLLQYMGNHDPNDGAQARKALRPLCDLLQRHPDMSAIIAHHMNKKFDAPVRYRQSNSASFRDLSRALYIFNADDSDSEAPVTVRPEKSNLLAPEERVGFNLHSKKVTVEVRGRMFPGIRKLMNVERTIGESSQDLEEWMRYKAKKIDKLVKWLERQSFYRDGRPIERSEIMALAKANGFITEKTVERAARKLHIEMKQQPGAAGKFGRSIWTPPKDD
jgi:hypothetical protein